MAFAVGDCVRVDIPDPDDPDHRYHGETGEVIEVTRDELGELVDDPRLNYLFTVEFVDASLGTMTFRFHDLVRL